MTMRRLQRVSSLLNEELAKLIEQSLDKNYGIVTLTKIDVQPDLKVAKVYISCLSSENKNIILNILKKHTIQFQHILGKRLKMRYTPRLYFYLDNTQEDIENVVNIIEKIKSDESSNK